MLRPRSHVFPLNSQKKTKLIGWTVFPYLKQKFLELLTGRHSCSDLKSLLQVLFFVTLLENANSLQY